MSVCVPALNSALIEELVSFRTSTDSVHAIENSCATEASKIGATPAQYPILHYIVED